MNETHRIPQEERDARRADLDAALDFYAPPRPAEAAPTGLFATAHDATDTDASTRTQGRDDT